MAMKRYPQYYIVALAGDDYYDDTTTTYKDAVDSAKSLRRDLIDDGKEFKHVAIFGMIVPYGTEGNQVMEQDPITTINRGDK